MSELQIKALQPKAQPPTPSCNIYTTAKRSMHTWESAGSLLNLQERVCVCVCARAHVLHRVWHFVTPRTVAWQAPLFMVICQAGILEWVAIFYSRGSSQPWIKRSSLESPALAGGFFYHCATREAWAGRGSIILPYLFFVLNKGDCSLSF